LELVSWQQAWVDAQDRDEDRPLPVHAGADYVRRLHAQYVEFLFDGSRGMTEDAVGPAPERTASAAIAWCTPDAGDGHASSGYDAAQVMCSECDGWEGTICPHRCGVHLVSVQAERER
jgi:hypothetical protein